MRALLTLVFVLAAAATVRAEIMVGFTAEWLSHESALVALATPIEVENIKGPGEVWFTRTRFRLDEVIKGSASSADTVTVYDYSYGKADLLSLGEARKKSRKLLVYAVVAKNMFNGINGKYVFMACPGLKPAFYVDEPVTKLYTTEFTMLTSFDKLLERTRKQVAQEAEFTNVYLSGVVQKKALEVPFGSEAHRHLYGGSSCFLWVPEYKDARPDPAKPEAGDRK